MTRPPQGEAWVCEVRPATKGDAFRIESRTRVLSWKAVEGTFVPVTAYGTPSRRAFLPDRDNPDAGLMFVEVRNADSSRRWMNPYVLGNNKWIDTYGLRDLLKYAAEGVWKQSEAAHLEWKAKAKTAREHHKRDRSRPNLVLE